jgi:dolichyl-phosphate beta-glucosyltransferase
MMRAIPPPEVGLVIPVHHCAGSLERSLEEIELFLRDAPLRTEVLLVDDHGSDPEAGRMLRRFATRPGVRLLRNDRNRGKGFSVRRGMLESTAQCRVFTDADIAYPLDEVWRIVSRMQRGADVAIACRVHHDSKYIMNVSYLRYFYTRHLLSRAFNQVVRLALLPGVHDTQAGLKGYTARAAEQVFPQVRIRGFGFDLECLYLARRFGFQIDQLPVRYRYADEPSTVRFVSDGVTMAADLARIRWRGWTGKYQVSEAPAARERPALPTFAPARVSRASSVSLS